MTTTTLRSQIEYLDGLMWVHISKLHGETYTSPSAQYVDALEVGRLASEIQTLQKALEIMQRHTLHITKD